MGKREEIYKQFLYAKHLRFSALQKGTGIRSNELAYYLKMLVKEGVLIKENEEYVLSQKAEKEIPFFHAEGKQSPLAVILVGVYEEGKVLMVKRTKRPYEGCWGLPGGRILLGETIEQAATRIVKQKTFLDIAVQEICAAGNERVIVEEQVKHGFVLLFVKAQPISTIKEKEDVRWFTVQELEQEQVIPSDYKYATGNAKQFEEFVINGS